MALMVETMECYPRPIRFGDLPLGPAPEPAHERCSGGQTTPGVMGGWLCRCPCHHERNSGDAGAPSASRGEVGQASSSHLAGPS